MKLTSLIQLMNEGGAVMWPLYVLLVITVVLGVERFVVIIVHRYKKKPMKRMEQEKILSILDMIAMIAPVIGFLGTVTGMISAFRAVSEATSVQLQVVAGGLYEALYTTAFGLIISIIATILSFLLELVLDAVCESEET